MLLRRDFNPMCSFVTEITKVIVSSFAHKIDVNVTAHFNFNAKCWIQISKMLIAWKMENFFLKPDEF